MRTCINFGLKMLSISAVSVLLINGNVLAGDLTQSDGENTILLTDSSKQREGLGANAAVEKDMAFQSKLDAIWEILEAE